MKCPLKTSVFFPSFIIFISGWVGSSVPCVGFFSSCTEWRLLWARGMQLASHCSGPSCCGALAAVIEAHRL